MSGQANQPDELSRLLIGLIDGGLDGDDRLRLVELLRSDPAARTYYLRYMLTDAALRLEHAALHPSSFIPRPSEASDPEPPIPPIVIDTSAPGEPPSFSALFAPGGWLFSYAAATAITGVMLLVFWGWTVSQERELVQSPPVSKPPAVEREKPTELVGRIIGTADCRLADPRDALATVVPLGRRYALSSGLLEISYDSGAKVILEGPCTYDVDSAAGGFLSLGKLTARVEKLSAISGQPSEIPNPKSQISKFIVRTPTAIVTDLGTEFGVEVDESGATRSHVFRGKVELRPANAEKAADRHVRVICLGENESVTVRVGQDQTVAISREAVEPGKFVRGIPRRMAMTLFDTGVGLKEGDPDPHWQLVARSDQPHFQPRPAVVAAIPCPEWLPNDCGPSQWISTGRRVLDVPDGVTFTFRTSFDLTDAIPGTAYLKGRFIADNHVNAIRLNGRPVPVPKHGYMNPFDRYHGFEARQGFLQGVNSLELDVYNGIPNFPDSTGAMGLRVELDGSVFSTQPGNHGQPQGREGTPMD